MPDLLPCPTPIRFGPLSLFLLTLAAGPAQAQITHSLDLPRGSAQMDNEMELQRDIARIDTETRIDGKLAAAVIKISRGLAAERRQLPSSRGPKQEQGFALSGVEGLIERTATQLDQTMLSYKEPGLDPLRDWAGAEIAPLRKELSAASPSPAPRTDWIGRKDANRLLDRLAATVYTIYSLGKTANLMMTVQLKIAPNPTGNMVLFASQQLCDTGLKQPGGGAMRTKVWRGLYRYEAGQNGLLAPCSNVASKGDRQGTLDLVHSKGLVSCDFSQPGAASSCVVR